MQFGDKASTVEAVDERLEQLIAQTQRVCSQHLALHLSRTHAEELVIEVTETPSRFGLWLSPAGQMPGDLELVSVLRRLRDNAPARFDVVTPERLASALRQRGICDAEKIAARMSPDERRREWIALAALQ